MVSQRSSRRIKRFYLGGSVKILRQSNRRTTRPNDQNREELQRMLARFVATGREHGIEFNAES